MLRNFSGTWEKKFLTSRMEGHAIHLMQFLCQEGCFSKTGQPDMRTLIPTYPRVHDNFDFSYSSAFRVVSAVCAAVIMPSHAEGETSDEVQGLEPPST